VGKAKGTWALHAAGARASHHAARACFCVLAAATRFTCSSVCLTTTEHGYSSGNVCVAREFVPGGRRRQRGAVAPVPSRRTVPLTEIYVDQSTYCFQ
jgi:hypothetical protein